MGAIRRMPQRAVRGSGTRNSTVAPTVPGGVDLGQSSVAVSAAIIGLNGTSVATLTTRDAGGNVIVPPVSQTIGFGLFGGGGTNGSFGAVTDHRDGTYTATFTPSMGGSASGVSATYAGQAITSAAPTIRADAVPAIASVTPATGATGGGSGITITLSAFSPSAVTVTVGGAAATSVVYNSSTGIISCVTPAGTLGAQDVVVTDAHGQAGTKVGAFTYAAGADICDSDFEDSLGDGWTNGDMSTTCLVRNTSGGTGGETIDLTRANTGTKSLAYLFPLSAGNVGGAFFRTFTAGVEFWSRHMYLQISPFNQSGGLNNRDQVKEIRWLFPSVSQCVSLFFGHSPNNGTTSPPLMLWDTWLPGLGDRGSTNNGSSVSAYDLNADVDSWICIETHINIGNPAAALFEVKINGTMRLSYTDDVTAAGHYVANSKVSHLQINGTINSMKQASQANYDRCAVSTLGWIGAP